VVPADADEHGHEDQLFSIQVRSSCGATSGQLIANYTLNRRSGEARAAENLGKVLTLKGESLARKLARSAGDRILSLNEAKCLASAAAKSLPGWNDADSSLSIRQVASAIALVRFDVSHLNAGGDTTSTHGFTVDRTTTQVVDEESGFIAMSAEIGSLTARLIAVRKPLLLSEVEAVEVARQIPTIAAKGPGACVQSGGPLSLDRIFIAVGDRCQGGSPAGNIILVAVDPSNGEVTDKERRPIKSSSATRVASELLAKLAAERTALRGALDVLCRAE
jgi:hypothetical protein